MILQATCDARVWNVNGLAKISLLSPHVEHPSPLPDVGPTPGPGERGFCTYYRQPIWAVPRGHELMICWRTAIDGSPHVGGRGQPHGGISLGTCTVSGRWHDGRWSFLEASLGKNLVGALALLEGEEEARRIMERRRVPGFLRSLSGLGPEHPPSLEAWAKVRGAGRP